MVLLWLRDMLTVLWWAWIGLRGRRARPAGMAPEERHWPPLR